MEAAELATDGLDGATWADRARRVLARSGYRSGAARNAVIDVLARHECCLSPQQIGDEVRRRGRRTSVSSVYRALELLDDLGLVHRLDAGLGAVRYEMSGDAGAHRHHHLLCERCGLLRPLVDTGLDGALVRAAERTGFAVGATDVVLRGVCPACAG